MATKILNLEDSTSVGKNWGYRFLSRHPQIKGMTGKLPDKARVQAATTEAIDGLYSLFASVKRDFNVRPENIWNMDLDSAFALISGRQVYQIRALLIAKP
ncbi:hypothetical protein K3495_g4043 [Podosphaera aphanis]|nr:hypothetical protein K3495_g4043 [Podosphaera aphanis]